MGSLKRNGQAAKPIWTLNGTNSQLRDLTASAGVSRNMRTRSLHSSRETKGDSQNSLELKAVDDNSPMDEKLLKSDKPKWVSGGHSVTTTVRKVLEQRDLKNHKYYKLLEILSNPYFLERCYSEIRSKPGNMTKGTDKETLDGIN